MVWICIHSNKPMKHFALWHDVIANYTQHNYISRTTMLKPTHVCRRIESLIHMFMHHTCTQSVSASASAMAFDISICIKNEISALGDLKFTKNQRNGIVYFSSEINYLIIEFFNRCNCKCSILTIKLTISTEINWG